MSKSAHAELVVRLLIGGSLPKEAYRPVIPFFSFANIGDIHQSRIG